jgi:hypothetical protein
MVLVAAPVARKTYVTSGSSGSEKLPEIFWNTVPQNNP